MSDEEKISVRVPGVGIVRFPKSMTEAEIIKARDDLIYQSQQHGTAGKIVGGAAEFFGKSVLPAMGTAVGGLLGPPGAIVGSMAGEGVNQALGITPPSAQDIATSGVLTAGGLGAVRGAGALLRRTPGVPPALHEMAAARLETMPGRFAPTHPSADLYAIVEKMNPRIATSRTLAAAQKIVDQESGLSAGLANEDTKKVAQGIVQALSAHGEDAPFQFLRGEMRRIGDRIGTLSGGGASGEALGAYKTLRGAMLDDLERAAAQGNPAMPAVQALKEANAARKMEHVVEDLTDLFSVKGGGLTPRPDGQFGVNFQTIIRKLEKDPSIRRSLGDDAYNELVKDLNSMWRVTPALPSLQPDAGSKATLTRTGLLGGSGAAIGGYLGGGGGAAIGSGTAIVAGTLLSKTLASLAATKAGRAVIRGMIEGNKGALNTDALAALAPAVGMTELGREATHGAVDAAQGFVGQ